MINRKSGQLVIVLCSLIMLIAAADAADLPSADKELIKGAGIPIYSGAEFVNGNQDVGFRFVTNRSPEDVRAWYIKELAGWSVYREYGGWILYKGKPGLGMGDLMTMNQVQVQSNTRLHEWFGIDKSMSTEIVIMIPGL